MEGALWSLVDESHLGKQPHQSPILEFTHQLRLQPVNGTIQEKTVNKRIRNSRRVLLLRLLHLQERPTSHCIQQLPDRLVR